jgi:polynucleotide 5'-hydroxyl-kinase GRC3/NOL9
VQEPVVPKEIPQAVAANATEPPSKKPRRSLDVAETETNGERRPRTRAAKKQDEPFSAGKSPEQPTRATRSHKSESQPEPENAPEELDIESEQEEVANADEMDEDEVASVVGDADGYESPAETPAEFQNFPLSKARLNKNNIVYSDSNTLCVRIKERTVCTELPG